MYITKQTISYGDCVYIKLTQYGVTIAELKLNKVSCITEIINELKVYTHKYRGIASLYIRNISCGWYTIKPIMLYSNTLGNGSLHSRFSFYRSKTSNYAAS
jgi:hypothetical protein